MGAHTTSNKTLCQIQLLEISCLQNIAISWVPKVKQMTAERLLDRSSSGYKVDIEKCMAINAKLSNM